MNTIIKRTDELATGDIVWNSGMRLQLGERNHRRDDQNGEGLEREGLSPDVFWFTGTILNVEEVNEAGLVPFSWRCETRECFKGTERYSRNGDKWQVQGNARARWHVEA